MPIRPVALFAVLVLVAMPSSALAQSAGDDQYTDPVPDAPQASPGSGGSGGNGSAGGGGSAGDSQAAGSQSGATAGTGADASSTSGDGSGSAPSSSADSLPRTGFPALLVGASGLLLVAGGRGLRRLGRERAPEPYAGRPVDVPPASPVARARRKRRG